MAQPQPLPPRFTYGDYLQWADGHRWELYEGEARLMSPAPSRLRNLLASRTLPSPEPSTAESSARAMVRSPDGTESSGGFIGA